MTSSTHGSLEYLDPHSPSELFNHTFSPPPPGKAQTNVVTHPVRVSISSLRALPSTATGFDTQHAGFELVRAFGGPEAENGWKEGKGTDEEWIKTVYYEDCKSLVKDRLSESGTLGNVKEVVVFDHTIRRRGAANVGPTSRAPVARVHVDQTPRSGLLRTSKHFSPELTSQVESGTARTVVVNVWRPLSTVMEYPLAVADSRTVPPSDLVKTSHIYKDGYIGETYNVLPSPTHKWYYAPHMSASEALLLKCYDSKDLNTRTPHTAFVDEQSAQDAPARESVEVRCLVRFE